MIQYNIIQDQTEEIFLYCIILAINPTQPTDLQLTRAGTKASKFNLFYKPFDNNDLDPAARALFLQNGQYFICFISTYEKSESNCSLTGPELIQNYTVTLAYGISYVLTQHIKLPWRE